MSKTKTTSQPEPAVKSVKQDLATCRVNLCLNFNTYRWLCWQAERHGLTHGEEPSPGRFVVTLIQSARARMGEKPPVSRPLKRQKTAKKAKKRP